MAYLTFLEAQEKTAVFTYGRNNPPTVGHEKLFNKTIETAKKHGTVAHIFTSHSQDAKKNPLTAEHKVELIKHAYPEAHVASSSKEMPSMLHIAKHLHDQGHKHLVMVAGSDRVNEYKQKLSQYNGTHEGALYNFKTIKVVSAGQRDPDAEGAAGMSGTKLRSHAIAGNKEKFKSGLMSGLSDEHKEKVYHAVRKALKVEEIYDPHLKVSKYQWGETKGTNKMKDMTPGEEKNKKKEVREDYVAGKVFKLGQLVETKGGERGTIVYRGPNYVSVEFNRGVHGKFWLNEVREINHMFSYNTFRGKIKEQKIPVLLMTPNQRKELYEQTSQLEFDGIQTKHLDMCPDAYKKFKSMIDTVRAGKHVGEPTGHEPDLLPKGATTPEQALRPAEVHVKQAVAGITPSTVTQSQVAAGIVMKPATLKRMQFKQYTGL